MSPKAHVLRPMVGPLAVLALMLGLLAQSTPASAAPLTIAGRVYDTAITTPLQGVCVTVGVPGSFCWATTAADGSFFINMDQYQASPGGQWDLYFIKSGFSTAYFGKFVLSGPYNTPPILMQTPPKSLRNATGRTSSRSRRARRCATGPGHNSSTDPISTTKPSKHSPAPPNSYGSY